MKRAWITVALVVAATAVVTLAYVFWGDTTNLELLRAIPPLIAAIAVAAVAVRSRPVRPVPWAVLAAGFAMLAVATIVQGANLRSGDWTFPGDREAVLLLAYPALIAGMIGLTSPRRQALDLLAGSEPIIYTIAVTALVWVGWAGPHFDGDGLGLTPGVWVWLFPLIDCVLATMSVRRMTGPEGPRRYELLTLGFLVIAAGHAWVAWSAESGGLASGDVELLIPAAGMMLVAAGVVMPDAGEPIAVTEPVPVHWAQIFGLLFAALVPLGSLLLMLATGLASRSSSIVVSVSTVAVIVLALMRMWHLVDQVRSLSEERGRDRLAAMVEHSSDVVLLADSEGAIGYVSPGVDEMLGHGPDHWLGRHITEIVDEDDIDTTRRHFEHVVAQGHGATEDFEVDLADADGQPRKAVIVIANLIGGTAVDGVVVTVRDVTEQRNLERQLSHRAFHDELTGLANRALFLDRMDHALRVVRSESDPVVVLFVDLDDFKAVNDHLGHGVGDEVLNEIADRIRGAAGAGDTAARLGGDEFAVLLEDRGGIDRAIDVAEGLLEALRAPVTVGDHEVVVLASVGVAVAAPGMSTTSLLRDADIAMYEAKRAGKGRIRIFDPAMRLAASTHLEYRADLAVAIERDQMRLVFQPYVDLATGQVVGAEALVRWAHPEHGDLSPTQFLPIAERSGLIVPIGGWVIDRAFEYASSWRPGLVIGVNVSTVQVCQPDFALSVVDLAGRHGVDPAAVVLEFNESVLGDGDPRIALSIGQLRSAGFRFAIDDFGSGTCSLAAIQRQPVDLLKIDGSAVASVGDAGDLPSLARTILQAAASLGISTVAEGIETTAQLTELRRQGCTLGQGFLLSHPLEASELARRFGHPKPVAVG